MKIINYICLISILLLLFTACDQTTTKNTLPGQGTGTAGENRVAGENAENSIKSAENMNSAAPISDNNSKRTEPNTGESPKFSGTIKNTSKPDKINSTAILKEVRTGRHTGYDRTVFEFEGDELPGYFIEYIDKPVRECGSGNTVELDGDGWLEIRFAPAQAHTNEGEATVKNRKQNPNYKILRQLRSTCDFEGNVTWVLGVSIPNEYRVIELKNPTRLVLDIKH